MRAARPGSAARTCVCACVRAGGRAGPCSRQGPALFQEINKRCRVPPPTEPRQKVDADRRHTQGFSERIWDVYGAASVRHPGCFFLFFSDIFFPFSFFFPRGSNALHCGGRRLCCLGVSQVTCKKPAPHLPDRFVRAAPESVGRGRQVGMDRHAG